MELHGILLLDKPEGCTSNLILQKVKKLLQVTTKAGHTGSLDPIATGMLPLCFGEATKFANLWLNADKSYQVTIQVGIKTDTGDVTGNIIARNTCVDPKLLKPDFLEKILAEFLGTYLQEPPIYAAIKFDGVALYKLARKANKECAKLYDITGNLEPKLQSIVVAKARNVTINKINILKCEQLSQQISLEVDCSKGTYIRSLVADLGKKINCYTTVAALRRTKVATFNPESMITLSQLEQIISPGDQTNLGEDQFKRLRVKNYVVALERLFMDFPKLYLTTERARAIIQGKKILIDDLNLSEGVTVALFKSDDKRFLGIGEINHNLLHSKRLVRADL